MITWKRSINVPIDRGSVPGLRGALITPSPPTGSPGTQTIRGPTCCCALSRQPNGCATAAGPSNRKRAITASYKSSSARTGGLLIWPPILEHAVQLGRDACSHARRHRAFVRNDLALNAAPDRAFLVPRFG